MYVLFYRPLYQNIFNFPLSYTLNLLVLFASKNVITVT